MIYQSRWLVMKIWHVASVDNKVKKRQKTKRKTDTVVDMSSGIADIEGTPDVATWNKKIHTNNAAASLDDRFHNAEKYKHN